MVVQTAVCDNRRKALPSVPKHVSDVYNAVDSVEHVVTHRGEKFVLQNDRENRMTILGCESSQNQLHAADVILMDGTFDCCLHHLLCGQWTSRAFGFLLAGERARGQLQDFVHENQ
jgi:hypothetical protein